LAAVACCFQAGDAVAALVRFYLPRGVVEARARTVPEYLQWVKAGILEMTEGTMIDYRRIEADLRSLAQRVQVQAIRFDQYASAQIVSKLAGDGYPAAILDKSPRNITPAARELESRVTHSRFRHDGNSCLRWMASNTVVSRRVDDSILPKKENADSPNKIDGIDAILQAMAALLEPVPPAPDFRVLVG
jgi:phage terminase large subunit-like protein